MSLSNVKSICKPMYSCYKILHVQLPSISSYRYKTGIQKKVRSYRDKRKIETPNSLLIAELEEESDYTESLTPEHIKDQVEFRKLDMQKMERRMDFKTVERRYFREYSQKLRAEPNLLTWAMKEHLINLHALDPENWNVENLSYAFPASQSRISKLLKTKLNPPSKEKRKKHDETVLENWKTLTKGKIGSAALLKKLISQKISDVGGETLPVLPEDMAKRMKDIVYTPVGDIHDEEDILSTLVIKKRTWFKNIIEKYEEKIMIAAKKTSDSNNNGSALDELQKCKNLDEIIPLRTPDSDQSPTVQIRHQYERQPDDENQRRESKLITYEEFLKKKSLGEEL